MYPAYFLTLQMVYHLIYLISYPDDSTLLSSMLLRQYIDQSILTQFKGFMLFGGDDAEGLNVVLSGGHGVMSVTGK